MNVNADTIRALLALATIIIFATVLISYMFFPIAVSASENVLMFMLGTLTANLTNVYQFFLGSSQGSKDKDDAMIAAQIVEAKKE